MKIILFSFLCFTLTACGLLGDELTDCINNDGPEFNVSSIPAATLNQVYEVIINTSIQNEPNDDWYEYDISFNGELPEGLVIYRDANDRTLQIEGTPVESGSFQFTLTVKVNKPGATNTSSFNFEDESFDDGDDLCYSRNSQKYTLLVNSI